MIFYFAGSVEAETLMPKIKEDPEAGVLFTFFDVPDKRFAQLKKEIRNEKQNKEKKDGTDSK